MAMDTGETGSAAPKEWDLGSVTEEERQIKQSLDVDEKEDHSEVMNDSAFL